MPGQSGVTSISWLLVVAVGAALTGAALSEPTGVTVSWSPVRGYDVNRYGVIVRDHDAPGAFISTYAATGTSVTVHGLTHGHRYDVWVATYVNMASRTLSNSAAAPGCVPASGPAPRSRRCRTIGLTAGRRERGRLQHLLQEPGRLRRQLPQRRQLHGTVAEHLLPLPRHLELPVPHRLVQR